MGRSLKKGPFVEERLMKRIDAMNAANEKKVVRHGQELPQFSQKWLGQHNRSA